MSNDLADRIRRYYDSAAAPVDAEEAMGRHTVRVEARRHRKSPLAWLGGRPAAAVGAAAVATLLVVGGVFLAVSSKPGPATPATPIAEVLGEATCTVRTIGSWTGELLPGDFFTQQRGQTNTCVTETPDPRVNGLWLVTLDCDYSVENGATIGQCWGTLELEGAGAGWEGTWIAITEWTADAPDIYHVIDADVVGTGGYAGLRYIHRIEGTLDSAAVSGVIGPVDVLEPPTTAGP